MGNRFIVDRAEKAHANCFGMWVHPHIGRFTKRKLSKARRQAWKAGDERSLTHWESICNIKNW